MIFNEIIIGFHSLVKYETLGGFQSRCMLHVSELADLWIENPDGVLNEIEALGRYLIIDRWNGVKYL